MDFFRYWGKARKPETAETQSTGSGKQYHLLPYHCLDVAAVAHQWWVNSACIRRSFSLQTGLSEEHTQAWLLFFVALHDYGKYDIRFQLKASDVWKRGNPQLSRIETRLAKRNIKDYWHGPAGVYWFYQDWKDRFSAADDDDFFLSEDENESWQAWLSWVGPVAGHHGSIAEDNDKEKTGFALLPSQVSDELLHSFRIDRQQWLLALEQLFLQPAGLALTNDPPQLNSGTLLAGFCSVADWLGSSSDDQGFEYDDQQTDDLECWFASRLPVADRVLKQSGILGGHIGNPPDIGKLLKGFPPRQVQCLVDNLPLASGLTLIEASTDSGKTEAALACAWRLLAENLADSIIFPSPQFLVFAHCPANQRCFHSRSKEFRTFFNSDR